MQSFGKCVSLLSGCAAFLFAVAGQAQNPSIRIMPLGDSITDGVPVPGGYREPLYHLLTNAAYNVDYVGTQTSWSSPTLPDSDHQGLSGWTIDGLRGSILDWFMAIQEPHVILVHIGTNDTGGGDFPDAINRLDALITTLATCQPSAHIIVTSLMKRDGAAYTAITNYFNPYVPGIVANQAALGRRVTFLDMHACLELSDMADGLHPNAGGYAKMAAAWFTAITNVVQPAAVTPNQPAIIRGAGLTNHQQVSISFNKKLSYASATNTANYAIDGGLSVTGAALSADQRTVTLTTTTQSAGTTYTVTLNNVADETVPTPLTVPDDSKLTFIAQTPRGYLNNVPESSAYTLVYSLDLPNGADYLNNMVGYAVDNSGLIGSFSRVAYYLELQTSGGDLQYLWASMDAFTNRADKLGVPTVLSGAVYQKYVSHLNVFCNVPGVTTGTGLSGNLEFWPSNYTEANGAGIPDANGGTYDFGDTCTPGGYGSMQIHNYVAKQTLFAINNWGGYGGNLCLGIGNQPSGSPDWTFNQNGGSYTVKTLQVLVLNSSTDTTPPTPVSAQAGSARNLVTVTFSEPLSTASVDGTRFTLNSGVQVLSATLLSDLRTVNLTTTPQPVGAALTLTITGIRDLCANPVQAGTSVAVAEPALPPALMANAGALADGYALVYALDIPAQGNFNALSDFYRYNQSSLAGAFDRVAYYVEFLMPNGTTQYLWASMDAFTADKKKIGVPTFASGAIFQQPVTNLDVRSNVGGIVNGIGMSGGNIEFWPSDYSEPNTIGITNASGTAFDFGDSRASYGGNYGCMQIHNAGASQTLFAMNHWGGDGNTLDLGLGTQPTGAPDWTFAGNAANAYARRTLYVLVRPTTPSPALPPELTANVGTLADGFRRVYTVDIPVTGNFNGSLAAYSYARCNLSEAFDRIAYYVELVQPSGTTQYLWAAMDAFTTSEAKIGIPTFASGAVYQQAVSNLDVKSNVGGIVNGTGMAGGNIEFWPHNYEPANTMGIANASDANFDFGDKRSDGGSHGSMQIHNSGASQTLFAMNNWGADGNTISLGLGTCPSPINNGYDWTFADNAGSYTRRTLHVLVRPTTPSRFQPTEVTGNVPEASNYQLAYVIDLPDNGDFYNNAAAYYTVNNYTNGLATSFSRIAYYLALQAGTGPTQYIWTAMDAFTADASRIGVPVGGTFFQQRVTRLDVKSNLGGIVTGTGFDTGNIEFWPSNYGGANRLGIPNANDGVFDFGDGDGGTGYGYGCMQVHNYGASQTLFAVNAFNGQTLCIGIGNCPSPINGGVDWTFYNNANGYNYRRLYVFVLPGGDLSDSTRPTVLNVSASRTLNKVTVGFSETLADSSATPSLYTLSGGATVTGAQLLSNKKAVILTTSALTAGQTYTLSLAGVRDRSLNGNPIAPGSSVSFTAPATALPPVLSNVPEAAQYSLIHQLAIPNNAYFVPGGATYTVDESRYAQPCTFDRVAYCLELVTSAGVSNWVYVSMDAFTTDLTKIGVPTAERGAAFQAYVNNMNVSAAAGANVTTGTGITTGIIEFWPSNYDTKNKAGIPGASESTFDFGDCDYSASEGHGSMQIHNYAAGQTLLAMNHFGANGMDPAVGIGNNPSGGGDPDWTFTYNASSYSVKNIYVLAHWGNLPEGSLSGTKPEIWSQPASRTVLAGSAASFSVYSPTATAYQWRKNGVWITGATLPWLDINPASHSEGGTYDVLVYGSGTAYTVSQNATLSVIPLGTLIRVY